MNTQLAKNPIWTTVMLALLGSAGVATLFGIFTGDHKKTISFGIWLILILAYAGGKFAWRELRGAMKRDAVR